MIFEFFTIIYYLYFAYLIIASIYDSYLMIINKISILYKMIRSIF